MRIVFILGALFIVSLLAGATPALADHRSSTLNIDASQAAIGDSVQVSALVTSRNGEPVAGAEVTYSHLTSFGGTSGFVVVGYAVTDAQGEAIFDYTPRTPGEINLRAEVTVNGEEEIGLSTITVPVSPTQEQLYRESGGIHIFGHEWILVAVVASVWAILFAIALGIADIATGLTEAREREARGGTTGGAPA